MNFFIFEYTLNHSEFGQTTSRGDGIFDLVVNGGGYLTLEYKKEGYISAQRQIDVMWNDFMLIDSVVLIKQDTAITTIDLADTSVQVARGSVMTDDDGSRQATILFKPGSSADMIMPDGSSQPIENFDIQITEYTVGGFGPAAMPAILPPTSEYTYCVDLSVKEAIQAGTSDVQFNQPVAFYVDNFLGFETGISVPTGYYDHQQGVWIPSENGRVIQILGQTAGLAEIDIDGDGLADHPDSLLNLGINEEERFNLAALYSSGKSLWRVEISHFSIWDMNWSFGPPEDSKTPEEKDGSGG